MFVAETSGLFSGGPGRVVVRVRGMEGASVLLEAPDGCGVDQLKIEAISQLYGASDACKLSLYYRLLHVRAGRVLGEEATLCQADVVDNGNL